MKSTRIVATGFLSVLILGTGVTVSAEENRLGKTENKVSFTADTDGNVDVEPPVTDPEIDPIDPINPGGTGPLQLSYVTPSFDFGQQVISTHDETYSMIADNQKTDGNSVPYVSFAQVVDTRGTHEGWNLNVSLSNFQSDKSDSILTGAKIEFVSPEIEYKTDKENTTPTAETNENESLILNVGDNDVAVMTAERGQGAGRSTIIWGDQEDLNKQASANEEKEDDEKVDVLNHNIILHVPGETTQDAANYTATMTWTLSSTVDTDGETIL